MSQTERLLRIQQMLQSKRAIPRQVFLDKLDVSLATFKRDLDFLRSRFRVDIEWSRELGGYYCDDLRPGAEAKNLAGPMYSVAEIHALLLLQDLVMQLQPSLLKEELGPLRQRLQQLLGTDRFKADEVRRRIRVLHMPTRRVGARCFQTVSVATLSRRRLRITYRNQTRNEEKAREISPQRLVYYRGNWYLDSWCHLRQGLRSFALDMIRKAEILDLSADEIDEKMLDARLGNGYGIYSGAPANTAVLRFEPGVAEVVAREIWHPQQTQELEATGHLVLTVPYSRDYELAMDIMRYGASVEVLAPNQLRSQVEERLRAAICRYEKFPAKNL
jgi:predicted DNA-binding transcriptional regulator YafY